ncbi:hypothetical protein B7494_g1137 [Chlorociboria aeruginascens]|nr:hypothetical protein B7494_g1137 [Chlorociboria aeruginascens]
MPRKLKRAAAVSPENLSLISREIPIPLPPTVRAPGRKPSRPSHCPDVNTNPDHNAEIIDGKTALRASPDADEAEEVFEVKKVKLSHTIPSKTNGVKRSKEDAESDSPLSDTDAENTIAKPAKKAKKAKKTPTKSSIAAKKGSEEIKAFVAEQAIKKAAKVEVKTEDSEDGSDERVGPAGDDDTAEEVGVMKLEAARPPPVNSDYLPLPWKGRLGYACLNTYLRSSNPPVFSSRTCRIASILEHRHPLKDPTQPEHSTKNRPDKSQPASCERGQRYVEELGLANARDIPKMLRWNDKYGIKFFRLSSEMFPFASHAEYGYKLALFASEALAEVGKVATELGHRLSTHPGQFTQLGSPREEVISGSIRDLEFHNEMLSLLKLPPQEDRDAVMILHMGGTFGDKAATIDRFRQNYSGLSPSIKQRLVLENDDVSWSVHDLLPICEELNIPLCLDFHHHNIIFDSTQLREGTLDIAALYPRIKATWDRKNIRQKMHYSEPTPGAITGRQRRKHNPRPATLPPCPNDMDLMIEAKDKEQAVFELMRIFKLPGYETFNNVIPYERSDDNRPLPKKPKKKPKKQIQAEIEEFGRELSEEEIEREIVKEENVGMGGKENRVYWPQGMEEWLRPKKREVKKDEDEEDMFRNPTSANFAKRKAIIRKRKEPLNEDIQHKLRGAGSIADVMAILDEMKGLKNGEAEEDGEKKSTKKKSKPKRKAMKVDANKDEVIDMDEEEDLSMPDLSANDTKIKVRTKKATPARKSLRASGKYKSYAEVDGNEEE